jgi:hypothetical protein
MRTLFVVLLTLVSTVAVADIYQVTFGWTDPTTYIPSDSPRYEAKYRVGGGTETTLPALTTPGGTATVTANPGQPIDVAARNCNLTLCSAWTGWVTATAPFPATQPQTPTGLTITVTRQ